MPWPHVGAGLSLVIAVIKPRPNNSRKVCPLPQRLAKLVSQLKLVSQELHSAPAATAASTEVHIRTECLCNGTAARAFPLMACSKEQSV